MPIRSSNGLSYYQFETFESLPIEHGIFTREGGVSPAPWHSLNTGGTVGDDIERVRVNTGRALGVMEREQASVFDVWQVHSADYVFARHPRGDEPYHKADIILTDTPEVTLFMRFADCVPILLVDPKKNAIALAHAGWLGTVRGAALSAVSALQEHCGSQPEDILAGLGPSIAPDHYQVGDDVIDIYLDAFPDRADKYFIQRNGSLWLDLWSANEDQLRSRGVNQIELARICTACDTTRWFSHRAEQGRTGRFGALLALKS
jgi:YfiH family protein